MESADLSKTIGLFVSSSDRTKDVFLRVYGHFDRMWPACPFSRYVGLTSGVWGDRIAGFTVVPSKGEAGWAQELTDQIRALPSEVEFILLLLDDFLLLAPVQEREIMSVLRAAVARDLSYLRLKPPARSWLVSLARRAMATFGSKLFHRLSLNEPYYSSLQAALWKRDHLLSCLEKAHSIWHFEHIVPANVAHWAVARPILCYCHAVEKSRWQAHAPSLFHRLGLTFHPGERAMHPSSQQLTFLWSKAKFGLIGYTWVRLKRNLFAKRSVESWRTTVRPRPD